MTTRCLLSSPARVQARLAKIQQNLLARLRLGGLRTRLAEQFVRYWERYYRRRVATIVEGYRSGRARYCQGAHSDESRGALFWLESRSPARAEVTDMDLSREESIIFSRIWSLIQHRLLPLAGVKHRLRGRRARWL